MSRAHLAAPWPRIAAPIAAEAAATPLALGSNAPTASTSIGRTAAIVSGVSP